MAKDIFTATQVEATVTASEAGFTRAFLDAIKDIVDRWTLQEIEELLLQGRVDDALDRLETASGAFAAQYGNSFSVAADRAARLLSSGLSISVAFDRTNDRAVAAIRRNQLRLVREFTAEQRRATRTALQEGITDGLNPRDQARQFRRSIGLTERQVRAVANFRRLLTSGRNGQLPSEAVLNRALRDRRFDPSIARAIREGRPLSEEHVDRMVRRYRERYLKYRAETIARTEALRSTHQGMNELYTQAIENGQIDQDSLERKWVTARDERVRSSHVRLSGMVRPLGETFPADEGPLRYPADPEGPASETINCRCVLAFRIK